MCSDFCHILYFLLPQIFPSKSLATWHIFRVENMPKRNVAFFQNADFRSVAKQLGAIVHSVNYSVYSHWQQWEAYYSQFSCIFQCEDYTVWKIMWKCFFWIIGCRIIGISLQSLQNWGIKWIIYTSYTVYIRHSITLNAWDLLNSIHFMLFIHRLSVPNFINLKTY